MVHNGRVLGCLVLRPFSSLLLRPWLIVGLGLSYVYSRRPSLVRIVEMPRHSRTSLDYDPLTAAIAPPSDETPEQRAKREQDEAEAQRVSDLIDEQLKAERAALKKKKPPIKVLLLGQSESGPSIFCLTSW